MPNQPQAAQAPHQSKISPFKDEAAFENELKDFANKYRTRLSEHSRRISDYFEMSCFNMIVRYYEHHGFTASVENLQAGRFRFKCSPSGLLENFSYMKLSNGISDYHIYHNASVQSAHDTDVFTEPTIKGRLGVNAMKANKHLYDHIVYDSTNERDFATDLDTNTDVAVYVKLPDGFYISTPVGHYNPDWAIAFYEGKVKHIYFVAETKGSMNSMQLRLIEESKIHCAREHFKAISSGNVVYDVVDSYKSLLEKVMK